MRTTSVVIMSSLSVSLIRVTALTPAAAPFANNILITGGMGLYAQHLVAFSLDLEHLINLAEPRQNL